MFIIKLGNRCSTSFLKLHFNTGFYSHIDEKAILKRKINVTYQITSNQINAFQTIIMNDVLFDFILFREDL